jgi:hypothetical protein
MPSFGSRGVSNANGILLEDNLNLLRDFEGIVLFARKLPLIFLITFLPIKETLIDSEQSSLLEDHVFDRYSKALIVSG